MTDLETIAGILKRGKIYYTIHDWHLKETGKTGKFIDVKQGDYDIYIEFDENGKVLEEYD